MKKLIAVAAIAAASLGTGLVHADPGPNGSNNFGLCRAYSSGSQNGQDHKHHAGPFQELERQADQAGDQDGTATQQEIQNFCSSATPGGK